METKKEGVVYGLFDPDTGNCRYVGQTTLRLRRRLSMHCGSARREPRLPVHYWILKLHAAGKVPWIERMEGPFLGKAELDAAEIALIAEGRAELGGLGVPGGLLNVALGGEGGNTGPRSEETRRKMSERMMGHPVSAEARRKMSENASSRRPEVKAKLAEARRGKLLSEETKAKISARGKGRYVTLSTRKKMGKASKARWADPALRARMGFQGGEAHTAFRADVVLEEITKRLDAGLTQKQVADELGISVITVQRRLKAVGLTEKRGEFSEAHKEKLKKSIRAARQRPGAYANWKPGDTKGEKNPAYRHDVSDEEILIRRGRGETADEIAAALKISRVTVFRRLRARKKSLSEA